MHAVLGVLGAALVVLTIVDLLWTALWVDGGAGPLTSRLSSLSWRLIRRVGERRSRLMSLGGPVIISASLAMWVGLLWAGWTLLFAADVDALVAAHTGDPAPLPGRMYFVTYSMFTMGNGDFTPTGGWWQFVAALTTGSGMVLVTMAISYVFSVLSAVAQKRAFASSVHGLGDRAERVVLRGWDGEDLDRLDLPLNGFASQIGLLADQHRAYPILHYYHSQQEEKASGVAIAILDDALTLIRCGVPPELRPNMAIVEGARESIATYLESLREALIDPAADAPAPPDLDTLRRHGVPTVDPATFEREVAALADRRRLLRGMVVADGWRWPEVES